MSFANELQKLKNLRDSGAITREEYEASRNRLLEECVRRIESVHDRPARPSSLPSQPPGAMNQGSENAPRVKFSRLDAGLAVQRSSAYSQELDYSLVKPAANHSHGSSLSSATAFAPAKTQVDNPTPAPSREERTLEPGIPRVKLSFPPPPQEPARRLPGEASRSESTATIPPASSVRVAYEAVKINPTALRTEARPHSVSHDVIARSTPPAAEDPGQTPVKLPSAAVTAFQVENKLSLKTAPGASVSSPKPPVHIPAVESILSSPREPDTAVRLMEAASAPQVKEAEPVEEFLPRFAAPYDTPPAEKSRWGLPHFKLVNGVVQDVRLSMCPDSEAYAAFVNVDGHRMEISSSSEIRIAMGDHVSLGGYERDGQLLVLGYRNETSGSHSDLNGLRKRYRFLLTFGRLSLLIGLAGVAATVMFFLHKPAWASQFAQWGFLPYVLSGLVAAAVSYLGLALSCVGKWAKEFHSALAPASSGTERASYSPTSLPVALR